MRIYKNSDTNVNKFDIGLNTVYDIMILNIQDENGTIPEDKDIFLNRAILSQKYKYKDKYDMLDNILDIEIIEVVDNYFGAISIIPKIFNLISTTTLHRGDTEVLSKDDSSKSITLQCKLNVISCEFEFNFLILSIIEDGYYYPISTVHIHPEKVNTLKSEFVIDYTLKFDNHTLKP